MELPQELGTQLWWPSPAGGEGMNRLRREVDVFLGCPRSMQVLLLANMIYALVLPVIEIFVAAYVMRNSHAVGKVVTYQLAVYVATPVAFFLNGILLGRVMQTAQGCTLVTGGGLLGSVQVDTVSVSPDTSSIGSSVETIAGSPAR